MPHTRGALVPSACTLARRAAVFGHGAEECRYTATTTEVEPPPEPPAPAPSSAPPPETATSSMPDPVSAEATSEPVLVPGFGCKDEGKSANYGTEIPPPTLVDPADLPAAIRSAISSSGSLVEDPHEDVEIPPPIAATTEDVF